MDINPKRENVDLINKKPLAYTIGVFIVLLSVFITRSFITDTKRNDDCDEQRRAADIRAAKSDSMAKVSSDNLVRYLLSEQDRKDKQRSAADSVVRQVLSEKAKNTINSHK